MGLVSAVAGIQVGGDGELTNYHLSTLSLSYEGAA